jgi:hypothetical protein
MPRAVRWNWRPRAWPRFVPPWMANSATPLSAQWTPSAPCSEQNGRLIVTGMGKSGHIGRKIAATLASTGTPAYFVHPGEASHGDLGMIRDEDAVLALSWSGEAPELSDICSYCIRFQHSADRHHLGRGECAGARGHVAAGAAAAAGSLPERAGAHDLHDHAAGHGRCAGGGPAVAEGLFRAGFPPLPPGRQAGLQAAQGAGPDACRAQHPAGAG